MKNARIPLILAGFGLPLILLVSTAARADTTTENESQPAAASTAVDKTAAVSDAKTDEAKPGRLRFRSATSSGCTSAKGGVGEADIRRAEEARTKNQN